MAQGPLRKEDVTYSLLASMRQATEKKNREKRESVPTKKLGDLTPLVLEVPTEGEKLTLEIRGDSKTIVDCVNSHAKLKTEESTIASVQNLLR